MPACEPKESITPPKTTNAAPETGAAFVVAVVLATEQPLP